MTPALRRLALVAALLAVPAAAGSQDAPTLTVFAAADLAFAFRDLVPRFERAQGVRVTLVLGSTGNLARQIEHGAPADVFFAADEGFVNRLVAQGVLVAATRALYARGRLVLATSRQHGPKLPDLPALLGPAIRRVAIANPAHAPYGRAAEEALRRVGVWEAVHPKLVYADTVRHALQYIQSGAAEAGLVALSVAGVPEIDWAPVDPILHAPLNQAVAVVRGSARPELGLAFIKFVSGAEGRAVVKRYGFLVPGEF